MRLFVAAALLLAPAAAQAAACCLSTSAFGAGRLAAWEDAAAGFSLGLSSHGGNFVDDGRYLARPGYTEREARATAFGIFRLARTLEAGVRVPWVFGTREVGKIEESGTGLGDLSFSLRWDALPQSRFPSVAFVAGATLGTGRSTAESKRKLGADVTGRGDTVFSVGTSVEKSWEPWFVRLDAAAFLPLPRQLDGSESAGTIGAQPTAEGREFHAGPGVEILLGGGAALGEGVVVSLVPRLRWESAATMDGFIIPFSSSFELAIGPAIAWDFSEHWTLQGSFDTGLPVDGLGRNRPLFTSASVGLRRGFF